MVSLFEQSGGTHRWEGDYQIPNLALSEVPEYNIGIWGQTAEIMPTKTIKTKERRNLMKATLKIIPIQELHPHPNNPYAMREDTEFQESINEYGVMSPLMVRERENGGYEIISGHRRRAAAEMAGMENVPVYICDLNDTDAVIALVDSNLHREQVLPSEKAFA